MTVTAFVPLEETLLRLARTPTSVPAGARSVDPGDPMLLEAVERLLPMLLELAPDEVRRHRDGDLALRFGPDSADGLLLQTYLVSQHGDPSFPAADSRVLDRDGRRVVVGPGTRQNKGAMASAIEAVRAMPRGLARPVWLTVNTEGSSSHGGSRRILDELGVRARSGVVAISTGMRVSLGNRGRVDLLVRVTGRSSHSSRPWPGQNPVELAGDALLALRGAPVPPPHALLGSAVYTPYHMSAHPVAPHTVPARVDLVIDRRMLPGERPSEVAAALRGHYASTPLPVEVIESESMLPALVEPGEPVLAAFEAALGEDRTVVSANTFDAGYACSLGIPTVMFGPGERDFGDGLTAAESITVEECAEAALVLGRVVEELCR